MRILIASTCTFVLCIPFGYWRATVRKFSLAWFAAVHLPVFLIIPLRNWWLHLSSWWLFLLVPLFLIGHRSGAALRARWIRQGSSALSACLVVDLYRRLRKSP